MSFVLTETFLSDIVTKAKKVFSDEFDIDLSGVEVIGLTLKNAVDICKSTIPEENFVSELKDKEHFKSLAAEALPGRNKDFVIIRTDVNEELDYFQILLHEFGHIFLTHYEIDGGFFYNRYCQDDTNKIENGIINAGYAIWREFAADICAFNSNPNSKIRNMDVARIRRDIPRLDVDNTEIMKVQLAVILSDIFTSKEAINAKDATSLTDFIAIPKLESIILSLFEQVHKKQFYKIDLEFIRELGSHFIMFRSTFFFGSFNTYLS